METIETGTGRTRVRLNWRQWGADVHVHIAGGDHHLGAVALVGRKPSGDLYEDVLCIPPHKEDELTLRVAKRLHQALGVNICVSAGIHLDGISRAEIDALLRNVDEGVGQLAKMSRSV